METTFTCSFDMPTAVPDSVRVFHRNLEVYCLIQPCRWDAETKREMEWRCQLFARRRFKSYWGS